MEDETQPSPAYVEAQMRHMALDFAARTTAGQPVEGVLKAAEAYLAFLKGTTPSV